MAGRMVCLVRALEPAADKGIDYIRVRTDEVLAYNHEVGDQVRKVACGDEHVGTGALL